MVSSDLANDGAVVSALVSDALDRIGSYPSDLRVASWIVQTAGERIVAVWGLGDLAGQHQSLQWFLPVFDGEGRRVARRSLRPLATAGPSEHVWAAIVQLPPLYRMAIVLRDIHDVPIESLTVVLGPCGVPARLVVHRARCAVAESLIASGVVGGPGGRPNFRWPE